MKKEIETKKSSVSTSQPSSDKKGLIVGLSIGGVIIIIGGLVLLVIKRKKKKIKN
jgi:LPXTG-motif cell wall-anchored protein